jgi:putative ABC transport system permease protein
MKMRWIKLWRDTLAERGRIALLLAAIAVSVTAFGTMLGVRDVLTREMARNYLGTSPAHATLELKNDVDAQVLALARAADRVEAAEAGDVLLARAEVAGQWKPVLLFVVDGFAGSRLNRFQLVAGQLPAAAGTALLERTDDRVLQSGIGRRLSIRLPGGQPFALHVSGIVHDPTLAPAWQEQTGYVYIDRATLKAATGQAVLHELRVRWRDTAEEMAPMERAAQDLARVLAQAGHDVSEVRVPPPRKHPHQRQMETVLFLLLAFSVLSLVLSGVLVANALAALLARQTREIAVMKTLGARTSQLAAVYAVLVVVMGLAAALAGAALAVPGIGGFAGAVGQLLNLDIASTSPHASVFAAQAAAAVCVPLALAAWPVWRACRTPIRAAMDAHGAAGDTLRRRLARWPMAWREALRRPARLALTIALLGAGGAMFMTALNVSSSWDLTIDKVYATRHYDIELRFASPQSRAVLNRVAALPGVRQAESWGYSEAAFARPGQIDLSHAYPDRGHGSFHLLAPPEGTRMVSFPVLQGQWLGAQDPPNAVVLNHAALAQRPGLRLGDEVLLSIDGRLSRWTLVGVVEEIGAAGVAYVHPGALAAVVGDAGSARVVRITSDAADTASRSRRLREIDDAITGWGLALDSVRPLSELRTAMGDHIVILIRSLVALAGVMALVGGFGLASSLGVSVLERTREFAVMKTLGAAPARLTALVLSQARITALASSLVAFALSLPLTAALDLWVGRLGFVAPLPFSISAAAVGLWVLLSLVLSWIAGRIPAATAAHAPVAESLRAL